MQTVERDAFIIRAYELARSAVAHGNHPFGALLVHDGANVVECENEVVTTKDVTRHAETGLVAKASTAMAPEELARSTLVTSTEPCIMCCGAIHWAGIGHVVYGVRSEAMVATFNGTYQGIPARDVFARINPNVVIEGPVNEDEGLRTHADFWPEFLRAR